MRIKDHWVEKEMEEILKERKNHIKRNFSMNIYILFGLAALVLFFMNFTYLDAGAPCMTNSLCANEGVSWKCSGCGRHCWSNARDWKGNYYCNSCGRQK